jgi:hypothetical protein
MSKTPPGIRFRPPSVTLPAELKWLLGAAFGPQPPAATGDPSLAADLARRFDLGPRIVARHGADRIEEWLGSAAAELVRCHRRAVAVAMAADRAALAVARLAASEALPVVFLKGFALQHTVAGPAGWRPFVDLDVLLARPAADRLRDLLVDDGWRAAEEVGNPQHLAPLTAPTGTALDIHFRLRGVRVATARWATAEELLTADLCRPLPVAAGAWVPRPPLLAAHLAAHAIEQHGHRPASYPLLRAVADIADLAACEGGHLLAAQAGGLTHESLTPEELQAVFTLGRLLTEARMPAPSSDDERGAEELLRHIVAGALDPDYRKSLAIDHTAGRLRQARQDGKLMRYIAGKLKPSADPSSMDDGESESARETVRQSRLRPIRLAARFSSAAAARLRRTFER